MDSNREIHISKFLSLILRHKPETVGITLSPNGWVSVDTLLLACSDHRKPITRGELQQVVDNDSKKRFEISPTEREKIEMIRASQGHSVNVDLGYEAQTPPDILYHGTALRFLPNIRAEGILKMSRQHVHLSQTEATAWEVGERHGKPAVLRIDAKAMHQAGITFYKSTNGVWLTDHVPVAYINGCYDTDLLEKPHKRVEKVTVEPWTIAGQVIRGCMADGRMFRLELAGFDKSDADPIIARIAQELPKLIAGTVRGI